MRNFFVAALAITLCVDVVLAQQGKGGKNTSLGVTYEIQSISLDDYRKAKVGVYEELLNTYSLLASIAGNSVLKNAYRVTYPDRISTYNIQLNHSLQNNITLSLRTLFVSGGDRDEVDWRDSAGNYLDLNIDWEFNISDIGIGAGYTFNDLILKNSRETFTFAVGIYSVKMKESTTGGYDITAFGGDSGSVSGTDSFSGNKIYFDFGWLTNVYLNKAKSISIDGMLGYKVVSFDKLGDYTDVSGEYVKFDFSGLKYALGLSFWF
jgi:hypothetical protein